MAGIDPAPGFTDPFQPLDERLPMVGVPEVDSQDALAIIFNDLVVFNEPFFLEDARQVDLHA